MLQPGKTDGYEYKLHRFWHAGDALMAYGNMALLYPEVKPITESEDPDILWGDANCDKQVDMSDAVLIMQSLSNPDKYGLEGSDPTHITKQGQLNADVYENGTSGITNEDALQIQKFKLELVKSLDPKDFVKE